MTIYSILQILKFNFWNLIFPFLLSLPISIKSVSVILKLYLNISCSIHRDFELSFGFVSFIVCTFRSKFIFTQF